ncbi:MAG: hypothetical protein IJZ59_04905 [Alphaproteobacteria bacterium]|nr:hypothetical protein [Alphaproteobacteria bacterium]
MYKFFIVILLICQAMVVNAQLPQYEGSYNDNPTLQEYFDAAYPHYDKSIIYIFYNNEYCYGCPQAIDMLEKLYYEKYADEYDLYIIDYQNDHEYNFISTYNLSQPLEVVLVRIQDGSSFGYEKIENLQNRIYDKIAFDDYIEYRINSFLGN